MKYFIESVKHYIDSPNNSSLLLTGEWGTGKTYFIKNILIKELLSNGKECLYISLNGIRNTNEIVRQIIATKLKLSQNVIIGSSFFKINTRYWFFDPRFRKAQRDFFQF